MNPRVPAEAQSPQLAPRCNYDDQCELVTGHAGEHWSRAEGWSDGDESRPDPVAREVIQHAPRPQLDNDSIWERCARIAEEHCLRNPHWRGDHQSAWMEIADAIRQVGEVGHAPRSQTDKISLEVFQHDWIPGFAAFHDDGDINESAKAHVVLNLGTLLAVVESGELPAKDLPYMVAESLMHEAIHALEAWASVEFSEERVETLLQQYRRKYRPDGEMHWQYDPSLGNRAERTSSPSQEEGKK